MKLSDLLVDLRKELTRAEDEKANADIDPKYKIKTINLEIYVENIAEGNGGVNFQVVNFGGKAGKKNYHKINIELKPLEDEKK